VPTFRRWLRAGTGTSEEGVREISRSKERERERERERFTRQILLLLTFLSNSTTPVIIVCYVPEEGGISNNIRIKFEAEVSKSPLIMLGRLDVEKQQELAMQLQLQEIPTIFAIYEKKVVNKISGNLKDTEIAGFVANAMHLAKLANGDAMIREAADLLTNGDIQVCVPVCLFRAL